MIPRAQENEGYWAELLLSEVNRVREMNQLQHLRLDEVLSAAAFDQAEYCSELGRLVHTQEGSKKENVSKRVIYYEGLHAQLEENLSQISFGAKEALEPNGIREEIDSDEKLVKAMVAAWLEDEKSSKLNVLDPDFYTLGLSVIESNEIDYLVCAVFGNEPYVPLGSERLSSKNYGIEPFNKQKCREFLEDFPSISQLFSDVVKIKGEQVYLEYHNLPFVERLLSEASDAMAIDWVDQRQYGCEQGTQLFPGTIAKGYLQKPFKKSFILGQNIADSSKELRVNLGPVPSFYSKKSTEPNLIIVKDGVHCATVPFNKIESKNTAQVALEFAVVGESESNQYTWKDSIVFEIPLFPGGFDSLQQAKTNLERLKFKITSSDFVLQLSPIHQEETGNVQHDVPFKTHIAWDLLQTYVKNTDYQLELAELTEAGKIEFLKEAQIKDEKLKLFLLGLNELHYVVKGEASIQLTEETKEQLLLYRFFLENNQINPALFVQSKLLNKVRAGALEAKELPQADPAQKVNTLAVINNQIVLESIMGAKQYGGNPIYLALFELYLINQKQPEVAFNYHVAKLEYWSKHRKEMKNMEGWLSDFRKISSEQIVQEKYARAMMNYYLLAVDYFYEKGNYDKRKKSFSELMKWQGKANLNEEEKLDLAKTLCYQDQFELAINLLQQELQEDGGKGLLLYYLQIEQYRENKNEDSSLVDYLKRGSEIFTTDFCRLFNVSTMGMQLLSHNYIKVIYCEKCR